jgi:PAS domain S-box-containing protein
MTHQHRIVAISENADTRKLLEACFHGSGLRLELFAPNFAENRSAIEQADLALVDAENRGDDILVLLREWQRDRSTRRVPLLLLSECDQPWLPEAPEAGPIGYICKPLRANEVLFRVRNALEKSEKNRCAIATEPSTKRYVEVFSSSSYAIAVLDGACRVLLANPSYYEVLGYNREELEGRSFLERVCENHQAVVRSVVRRLLEQWPPENHDISIKRRDESTAIVECSFSSLVESDGEILVLFRDVTEARSKREELVKTKTFLESLISTSVDAIVACDLKGTIILFNRAAESLYIRRADEVLNKLSVKELYVGDGARAVGRMLRSKKFSGRIGPVRVEGKDSQGNTFPVSLTAATIYDEHNNPVATCGIFTDLRERLRVEQELARVQEKLISSEKQALVAEVAGATAHELNQPLTGVMGYSELLLRKLEESSEVAHAASAIYREAERMAEIVKKIGQLTRYETRSYVGQQKILDLDRSSRND